MTIKLIIKDEVNIKLTGLPLEMRKKLSNHFKYEDPTSRFNPARRLGRWDGMVSMFGIGGDGYLSQLEKIVEILSQAGLLIEEVEDKRSPIKLDFSPITKTYWADRGCTWPQGHQLEGEPIVLRDEQVDSTNKFLDNSQALAALPTGLGKSLIIATLVHICEPLGRTIVIVPNKSLVNQTLKDFVNLGLDVGVYYGDHKDLNKTHTICTWQSLSILEKKSKKNSYEEFTLTDFLHEVKTIIVDEVHTVTGTILRNLLTRNIIYAPIRWGLTGTIPKEPYNYESLVTSIGPVINSIKTHDLQEKGILSNCHVHIKQLIDLKEFNTYPEEHTYLTSDKARIKYIKKIIEEVSLSGNTLVLVNRITSGKSLSKMIPGSVFVSGSMKVKNREEQYDEVKTANNKVIIATYGVAAVGIDIPRIFNMVLVEPGKSFVRVIQSIGRGIRTAKDKDFVDIYDITSTCKYSRRHLTDRKKYYKEAQYPFTIEKIDWNP